jgi:hypothetical protein
MTVYSRRAMLRSLVPYLLVGVVVTAAGGWLYGSGAIGVPATCGLMILASLVVTIGYVRWDEQHHR